MKEVIMKKMFKIKSLLIIIWLFLMLFAFTACGGSSVVISEYRMPSDSLIQFIAPLCTLEEVKDITATHSISLDLDGWPENGFKFDSMAYDIHIIDKWQLQNSKNENNVFTIAYAMGAERPNPDRIKSSSRIIRINGEEADYKVRVGYQCSFIDGTNVDGTRRDNSLERLNHLKKKEYFQSAIDEDSKLLKTYTAMVNYCFIEVDIPAGKSIEIEFNYTLKDTYRLVFIDNDYGDIKCDKADITLQKSDKVVMVKQSLGFDENEAESSVTIQADKEDHYLEYRIKDYWRKP